MNKGAFLGFGLFLVACGGSPEDVGSTDEAIAEAG